MNINIIYICLAAIFSVSLADDLEDIQTYNDVERVEFQKLFYSFESRDRDLIKIISNGTASKIFGKNNANIIGFSTQAYIITSSYISIILKADSLGSSKFNLDSLDVFKYTRLNLLGSVGISNGKKHSTYCNFYIEYNLSDIKNSSKEFRSYRYNDIGILIGSHLEFGDIIIIPSISAGLHISDLTNKYKQLKNIKLNFESLKNEMVSSLSLVIAGRVYKGIGIDLEFKIADSLFPSDLDSLKKKIASTISIGIVGMLS